MSMPALPDWLPWWVPILVLVPALLYALALLLMPFAVFGVKGRLEAIEARLDEIQGEIRSLALRMPEPVHHAHYDEAIYAAPPPGAPQRLHDEPETDRRRAELSRTPRIRRGDSRTEPKLDWPG